MSKEAKMAYSRIVFNDRPLKTEKQRTTIAIGSNVLECDSNTESPVSNIITMKLLLNSVLNTPDAKFMHVDIKDYYLVTKINRKQH